MARRDPNGPSEVLDEEVSQRASGRSLIAVLMFREGIVGVLGKWLKRPM